MTTLMGENARLRAENEELRRLARVTINRFWTWEKSQGKGHWAVLHAAVDALEEFIEEDV